jgi:superfamily II DNA/RNA helicase
MSPDKFPPAFLDDRRGMEATRLRLLLTYSDNKQQDDLWERVLRAATLLENSSVLKEDEAQRVWEMIALTYESVGVVKKEKRDYQWLLSALCWQLAGLPSIAEYLAQHLISSESYSKRDLMEQLAIAFSARNFRNLRGLAEFTIDEGNRYRVSARESKDFADATEAVMLLSIGTAFKNLTRFISYFDDDFPDISGFNDFNELAKSIGDSRRFRVGRLLTNCALSFLSASSRLLIQDLAEVSVNTKKQISQHLRRYIELWPSQREAIDKGLLSQERKHFVVSVPTSSGKTLCGELVIIQELTDNSEAVCFYVVPTRALVEEKSRELKSKLKEFGFKVESATGALQRDEIENSLFIGTQVIVCTPEKLDLLIRHDDESFRKASLFIIDESQMISDPERGLGLEFVVVKIRILSVKARIILLSAMIPNSEDFGRWIAATVASSEWRPTRQRFGEINFNKLKPSGCLMNVSLYDASGEFDGVEVPIESFSRQPKTFEKVVWAVEAFRRKGPVLVFCMRKPRCEELVGKIVDFLKERRGNYPIKFEATIPEVEELRRVIAREVSDDFLLRESLAYGVAYHHADLPPRIRIALEHLISNNKIEVVVSTTTLAEGVNLPISTVIYEDWMSRVDRRTGRVPEPLDLSKFRNIAGRAGRARQESEGLILFLDPGQKPVKLAKGRELTPREYFIREEYPDILSRFLDIIINNSIPADEALDYDWEHGDLRLPSAYRQALRQFGLVVLHAMEVFSHLQDSTLIDFMVTSSLLATQAPERIETAKTWFGKWVNFYRRIELEKPELRHIAMQIGLPLRAVRKLYGRLISDPEILALFSLSEENPLILSEEQMKTATQMVADIEELDWIPSTAPHVGLMQSWLRGRKIETLTTMLGPHLNQQKRFVEQTCNYTTQRLSNAGAWGMYALRRMLELILGEENVSPIVKRLPLLMYFGVDTTPAAVFALMGIERIDAIRLGNAFLESGEREASIHLLKTWASIIDLEELKKILRGKDERELDYETINILRTA